MRTFYAAAPCPGLLPSPMCRQVRQLNEKIKVLMKENGMLTGGGRPGGGSGHGAGGNMLNMQRFSPGPGMGAAPQMESAELHLLVLGPACARDCMTSNRCG